MTRLVLDARSLLPVAGVVVGIFLVAALCYLADGWVSGHGSSGGVNHSVSPELTPPPPAAVRLEPTAAAWTVTFLLKGLQGSKVEVLIFAVIATVIAVTLAVSIYFAVSQSSDTPLPINPGDDPILKDPEDVDPDNNADLPQTDFWDHWGKWIVVAGGCIVVVGITLVALYQCKFKPQVQPSQKSPKMAVYKRDPKWTPYHLVPYKYELIKDDDLEDLDDAKNKDDLQDLDGAKKTMHQQTVKLWDKVVALDYWSHLEDRFDECELIKLPTIEMVPCLDDAGKVVEVEKASGLKSTVVFYPWKQAIEVPAGHTITAANIQARSLQNDYILFAQESVDSTGAENPLPDDAVDAQAPLPNTTALDGSAKLVLVKKDTLQYLHQVNLGQVQGGLREIELALPLYALSSLATKLVHLLNTKQLPSHNALGVVRLDVTVDQQQYKLFKKTGKLLDAYERSMSYLVSKGQLRPYMFVPDDDASVAAAGLKFKIYTLYPEYSDGTDDVHYSNPKKLFKCTLEVIEHLETLPDKQR